MDLAQATAAVRFGLGRRPDEPVPSDPVAWAERQIGPLSPQRAAPGQAPLSMRDALDLYHRVTIREKSDNTAKQEMTRRTEADAIAWVAHCLTTEVPFQDRLTNFWANHFTMSRRVRNAGIFVGPQLRESIRPHQFGRFSDMLLAVTRNPGMTIYLSNGRSAGPNSVVGRRDVRRGLNENFGREVLELHTLSPDGGYSQADVTALAKILTGWGVDRQENSPGFRFRDSSHEPGSKRLLGRDFPEGEQGGIDALRFLADHPATHRHLATKLARHFVADDPPKDAVDRLYAVLRDTRGDLGAVSRAVARLPGAWSPPLSKVRSPFDWIVGVGRALGAGPAQAEGLHQAMGSLGQPLWGAPQPVGWPDVADEWAVPEALLHRIEWAHTAAGRAGRRDAVELARTVLGPLAGEDLSRELRRAGSPQDALTLLLVSPEFQRR